MWKNQWPEPACNAKMHSDYRMAFVRNVKSTGISENLTESRTRLESGLARPGFVKNRPIMVSDVWKCQENLLLCNKNFKNSGNLWEFLACRENQWILMIAECGGPSQGRAAASLALNAGFWAGARYIGKSIVSIRLHHVLRKGEIP